MKNKTLLEIIAITAFSLFLTKELNKYSFEGNVKKTELNIYETKADSLRKVKGTYIKRISEINTEISDKNKSIEFLNERINNSEIDYKRKKIYYEKLNNFKNEINYLRHEKDSLKKILSE